MTELLSDVGLTYDLNGLLLNVIDDSGVEWPAVLDGWDAVPDPVGDPVQRPNDDGADFADLYLPAKPMTLNGLVKAPTQDALYRARDALFQAAAMLRTTGALVVNEPIPKRVEVRNSGGPAWSWVSDRIAQFTIPLEAADPLRYSAAESAIDLGLRSSQTYVRRYNRHYGAPRYGILTTGLGGQGSVVNAGVFATYPRFEIRGPVTNPVIELGGTGKFLAFTVTLTNTDRLVVDARTRSVQLNGSPSRWLLTDGGFFRLPPGSSELIFRAFDFNAAARLSVTYRSAWL